MSIAARSGHVEVVALLTSAGVDVNLENIDGNTPLGEAAGSDRSIPDENVVVSDYITATTTTKTRFYNRKAFLV